MCKAELIKGCLEINIKQFFGGITIVNLTVNL